MKIISKFFNFRLLAIVPLAVSIFAGTLFAQNDREQKPGEPKENVNLFYILRGEIRSKETGELTPNADITITDAITDKELAKTKAGADGTYEIELPKGSELEVTASAPEFFYDAFKIKTRQDGPDTVRHDFSLPSELSLRINFPSNKFDDPYPFVLDEDGEATTKTWREAVDEVAEDINKYSEYISKVSIVGHTDDVGSDSYNQELGQKRAEFVRDELQKRGVDLQLMDARSEGENMLLPPRDGEDRETTRRRSRRVVMNKEMK